MRLFYLTALLLTVLTAHAQQFWLTTYSFPGGHKTDLTMPSDSTLLVVAHAGVIRSFDQGITFDTVLQGIHINCLYTTRDGMILAGGDSVIYSSFDNGDFWYEAPLFVDCPVLDFAENSVGYLFAITGKLDSTGFTGAGVLVSTNGGNTWQLRNNGLNGNLSCDAIAIDKNDRVYLGVIDDDQNGSAGLFYSDNSGVEWHQVEVTFDGEGVINDELRLYKFSGISVSPQDSIYISFDGAAGNVGVSLNLYKSIDDVLESSHWNRIDIGGHLLWWNDLLLHDIHFAQNGDWYSSTRGSIVTGATYYSTDRGKSWERHDEGLGLNILGSRSPQFFAEISTGRIFMVQHLAELIHYTDKSLLTTSADDVSRQHGLTLFPNPVACGNPMQLLMDASIPVQVTIYDIYSRIVSTQRFSDHHTTFRAPNASGIYFLVSEIGNTRQTQKFIVHE